MDVSCSGSKHITSTTLAVVERMRVTACERARAASSYGDQSHQRSFLSPELLALTGRVSESTRR